jgi:YHS domain-containing protein
MIAMVRILIFILFIAVTYVMFRVLQGIVSSMKSKMGPGTRAVEGGEMVQDPVCGLYIPKTKAIEGRVYGQPHFFCSLQCLEKYRAMAKGEKS